MTRHLFIALCALALAASCAPANKIGTPAPLLTPPPAEAPQPVANPGSLFSDAEADYLFSDNRARRIGDIVQINIVEDSTAKNKAETSTDRDSSIQLDVTNMFGKDKTGILPFSGINPLGFKGMVGDNPLLKAQSVSEFAGTGETKRENTFSATVAARVVNVLPGGTLQVEGGREIRVNEETQVLVVRGLVRPRDIAADNTILSSQLADAQIEYYGKGVVADRQKPGWLVRVMDQIWPF